MIITFNFDTNEVTIDGPGQKGTEYIPGLNERLLPIVEAAGMEMIPGNELCNDIDALFETLGFDVRCNREE